MAKWNWNPADLPPMAKVIPLGDTVIKDGMVLLLRGGSHRTILERLFRASGGGFGTHPGALSTQGGKIFGTYIETDESGYAYRSDVEGIYRGPIPEGGPRWYRRPYGYWVKRMPEIIKFVTNLDRKYKRLANSKEGYYGPKYKALEAQEKAIAREVGEGFKEIDSAIVKDADEFNKQEKMRVEALHRAGEENVSWHIKPAITWEWTVNMYFGILRQGGPKESMPKAVEGLMEAARTLDDFNAQQEREEPTHGNPRKAFPRDGYKDPFKCDFDFEERRARKWTDDQLSFAIQDAREAIRAGVNTGKYFDQLSVYYKEAKRRLKGK